MGNTVLSAQAPLWDVRTLLQELPQFVYARSLGTAKFMKAVLCKSDEGPVVVKARSKTHLLAFGERRSLTRCVAMAGLHSTQHQEGRETNRLQFGQREETACRAG